MSLLSLFGDPGFFSLKYIKAANKSCFLVRTCKYTGISLERMWFLK